MIPFPEIPVTDILLQRPPFVFIDKLLSYDEKQTRTAFTVPREGYFIRDGVFSAAGVAENIAQTCAARMGFVSRYIQHKSVRPGFLGQFRRFRLHREPRIGEQLETTVHIQEEVFGITLAEALVRTADGETIAEATVKTAVKENV